MFADSRWVPIDPPESLDNEGAELVLIGGQDDLGIDLKSHRFGAMRGRTTCKGGNCRRAELERVIRCHGLIGNR